MVTKLGMSDVLGPINYAGEGGEVFLGRDFSSNADHSDATAAIIDKEVHNIIEESYAIAIRTLEENISKLHLVANYLMHAEVMDGDQFKAAMEQEDITIEQLDAIAQEKKQQSRQANQEQAREEAEQERKAAQEQEAQPADPFDPASEDTIREDANEPSDDSSDDSSEDSSGPDDGDTPSAE